MINRSIPFSVCVGTLFIFGVVAPWIFYPTFVMKVLCFALFAASFNLLLGFAGLLSFGHAAFFGGSAYLAGYLCREIGLNPEWMLLCGLFFGAAFGFVFGKIAIRRSGIYFSMITLGLAQVIFFLALQLDFTGGESGLQGIPRGYFFGFLNLSNNINLYYVVLIVFMGGFVFIHRVIHSPFGQILMAIRDNEARATSLGYCVADYKLLAFVLSAALAGLAGATKALVFQMVTLTDVSWHLSGDVILMTILGGMGTLLGPLVGAASVVGLEVLLSDKVGPWINVVMGVAFAVCVLSFRRGIVGELRAMVARCRTDVGANGRLPKF